MAVQLKRRRFTTQEYHRMGEAGLLGEDDRVELIEGEIIEMAPIGSRHAACVLRLTKLFTDRLGDRALVSVQNPIRLGEHSEPQPDVTLLRPRGDFYQQALPGRDDIFLVIEVVDTTGDYDRAIKLPLYARHGIAEAWLVDLAQGHVEVYRDPSAAGFSLKQTLAPGSTLSPLALPDVQLDVAEVVGDVR